MRIISGEFKSRKLDFKCSPSVRPMTDRMKETLFNILGETVRGARVLDLFAGSGSIGLEALSRGAEQVTFVEVDPANCKIILKNIESLGIGKKAKVVTKDAFLAIKRLESEGEKYGLIFTDPPYDKGLMKKILLDLDQSDILSPHARVISHHSAHEGLPDMLTSLLVERSKEIGQARLSFLYRKV